MKKMVLLGTILCLSLVGLAGCGNGQNSVNPTGNPVTALGLTGQGEQSPLVYTPTDEPTATSEQDEQPIDYMPTDEPTATSEQDEQPIDYTPTDEPTATSEQDEQPIAYTPTDEPTATSEQSEYPTSAYAPTDEPQATSEQREYPTSAYALTDEPQATSEQSIVTASHIANNFVLSLFTDKEVYSSTEAIQIWATLEYLGNDESVKIWHGSPAIIFTVEGEDGFNIGGSVGDVLLYTVLQRGYVHHFDFQKSGGWCADSPDAYFWESFFAEPALFLPAGEYTIAVIGAFSFTERMTESPIGLRSEITIRVE